MFDKVETRNLLREQISHLYRRHLKIIVILKSVSCTIRATAHAAWEEQNARSLIRHVTRGWSGANRIYCYLLIFTLKTFHRLYNKKKHRNRIRFSALYILCIKILLTLS